MKIGVVFCTTDEPPTERDLEKLADLEILEVAAAVQKALQDQGHQVEQVDLDANHIEELLEYDWIFNLIETVCGYPLKDYEITAAIEEMGIPFTGSCAAVLKTCNDKSLTKNYLRKWSILTPGYKVYPLGVRVEAGHRFPLIVKPALEDGSIGIFKDSVVYSLGALSEKVSAIHEIYHQAALVEEYIDGRDITVSILGNRNRLDVFPPGECIFRPGYIGPLIQTFESKWIEDSADYLNCYTACPCDLDAPLMGKIKDICARAYRLLGCRDYARVDLRLLDRNPYIIEVNPNPCINPHDSGYVRAAKAGGYSFDELINVIMSCSQSNWKHPIRKARGVKYGHFIEKTYPGRPVSDYQFIASS